MVFGKYGRAACLAYTCGFGQHLFDLTMMNYGNEMWGLSKHCERFPANATSLHTSLKIYSMH